jgi:hypothetical protein
MTIKTVSAYFFIFAFASMAKAEIQITSLKEGEWFPAFEESGDIEIKGTTSKIPKGTQLELSLIKTRGPVREYDRITSKVEADGKFVFTLDHIKLVYNGELNLKIDAIEGGKISESKSLKVYCCSTERKGFFKKLAAGTDQNISVNLPGAEIDGVGVFIPKKNLGKDASITIGNQLTRNEIPLDRYTPIGPLTKFFFRDVKSPEDIIFKLVAKLEGPRDSIGKAITKEDWSHFSGRVWQYVDLKKVKVVILYDYGNQWKEIIPDKIVGDQIYFKSPQISSVFVPVILSAPSK